MKLPPLTVIGLFLASCIANNSTAFAATDMTASSFELASDELKAYCIERLCLGMTLQEVEALGNIKWKPRGTPDGVIRCETGRSLSGVGEFIAQDGTTFHVWFGLVAPSAEPAKRYRLLNAQIQLPEATPLQADHLAQTLIDRYGPMRAYGGGSYAGWAVDSNSGLFSIAVTSNNGGIKDPAQRGMKDPAQIGLSAMYKHEQSWLLTLPECRAGLPKL